MIPKPRCCDRCFVVWAMLPMTIHQCPRCDRTLSRIATLDHMRHGNEVNRGPRLQA